MAQVESTPGKNIANGTVTVASGEVHDGSITIVNARATAVPYSQIEPGRHGEDKRS